MGGLRDVRSDHSYNMPSSIAWIWDISPAIAAARGILLTEQLISDFDLYLFGEGKHERIYDKLGAHPYGQGADAGTRFAVWAPNAERVGVVGPFNHWDGRAHVMHGRGSSGIWELAIPGI